MEKIYCIICEHHRSTGQEERCICPELTLKRTPVKPIISARLTSEFNTNNTCSHFKESIVLAKRYKKEIEDNERIISSKETPKNDEQTTN